MTKESKQKFLQAVDLLQSIATAQVHKSPPGMHHSGKGSGGYFACDFCGGPFYEANQHSPECDIGNMLKAAKHLCPYQDREAWINDDSQPAVTFTPPVQPEV